MSRWWNVLLLVCNGALFLAAGWFVLTRGVAPAPAGWSHGELLTLVLAALAVILAAVTVFIALAAFWGYAAIREGSIRSAEDAARTKAEEIAARVARATAEPVAAREAQLAARTYLESSGGESSEAEAAALKKGGDDANGGATQP